MTLLELVEAASDRLDAAGVSFGHGTTNAFDEAAWLVLWRLGLPLDTDLEDPRQAHLGALPQHAVDQLIAQRIASRLPAAYLTGEAWLQGLAFHADARAIVPRSLIAELVVAGALDHWFARPPQRVLDLCTGGASLAIHAALHWPQARVDGADISAGALSLARRNLERHHLVERVRLLEGDGCAPLDGVYDLVLCNPPYVNAGSMAALPAEYRAEPVLALAGGADGMDFVRRLLCDLPPFLADDALLVLEIGHERANFECAFPDLQALWQDTSAGDDQVCVITRAALTAHPSPDGGARPRHNPSP
jgi:ribosomal protein L3 glutamine methyltransferase